MKQLLLLLLLPIIAGCQSATKQLIDFPEVIVFINVEQHQRTVSSGSGIIIDVREKGDQNEVLVLTAKHVIDAPPVPGIEIFAEVLGGKYQLTDIYPHPDQDAALVVFTTTADLHPAEIDFNIPKSLEEVVTAGYPLGMELTVALGLTNYQVANELGYDYLWLCTAPGYPGNSGGGIFDRDTRTLIGISLMVGGHPKGGLSIVVPHIHIFLPMCILDSWISEVKHARA